MHGTGLEGQGYILRAEHNAPGASNGSLEWNLAAVFADDHVYQSEQPRSGGHEEELE